jgi:arylsulfatase A-like enzyme
MLISLIVLATALPTMGVAATDRPNVILIMTDDQGGWDCSIMGNPVMKTPNMDRLATHGAHMTRFYVSPVCTPTRACLMTGRYNYRTRAIDTYVGRAMMEPQEVTVAEILRDAGYGTGIFGKWHLGDNYPMRPMDQGFAESLVIHGGGIGQPSDPPGGEGKYTDPVLFHNGRQVQTKGYCTDVYFNAAMEFIEKNVGTKRNFFAYIATNAPHAPLDDVPPDLYKKFKQIDLRPLVVGTLPPDKMAAETDRLARILAMVANIDDNIGRLTNRLEKLGVLDNTLVFFLTDNGPNTRRFVGPLRGMKADVLEGGVRTAFFAQWPARIKPGTKCDTVAAHIDVLPTILEACGVAPPAGLKLDGRSILPLLLGEKKPWPDRTIFLQTHRGDVPVLYHHFSAINWPFALVNASGFGRARPSGAPSFELYNLQEDPGEKSNLAGAHPEIVDRLRREYEAWFKDVSSTRSDNYAPPRIYIGTPYENPTTLTRQDWRRSDESTGYGTGGVWLLHVAKSAKYDIRIRWQPTNQAGTVRLKIQGVDMSAPLAVGARECVFESVELQEGSADLNATRICAESTVGPWQVDVLSR